MPPVLTLEDLRDRWMFMELEENEDESEDEDGQGEAEEVQEGGEPRG